MKKQQATVRVPATTSNLGPGFDCLGVALKIYNFVRLTKSLRVAASAMAREAGEKFFAASEAEPFAFSCEISGDVPAARGLGSSVTIRLGVLRALNALTNSPLPRDKIFRLCAALEGHPDNAAPAAFGGFVVARGERPQKFSVASRLKFVLLIPPFEVATEEARAVLPRELDRRAALRSSANACGLVAAFASRRYELLHGMFVDEFHQPFRRKFVPFLDEVIAAGEKAGALGGFLSGSGSTVACLTLGAPQKVADAMLAASGLTGARTLITTADNFGARMSR